MLTFLLEMGVVVEFGICGIECVMLVVFANWGMDIAVGGVAVTDAQRTGNGFLSVTMVLQPYQRDVVQTNPK
jgi:hypothetical protein